MKDQTSFSAAELREKFEKALQVSRETFAEDGTDVILRHMSDTVRALQEAGGSIGISVRAGTHTNAYDMMYTAGKDIGGGTIDVYGHIRIGESVRLFAIASQYRKKAIACLYLSDYNTAEEGGRNVAGDGTTHASIAAECFDFNEDPEALQKFQKKLIKLCAENAIVAENDSSQVFGKEPSNGDALLKTAIKPKRQTLSQ